MTDNLRKSASFPRRRQRPTSVGSWSLWLLSGFAFLMILPLVAARAIHNTETAPGSGRILWRFDSGG